MFKNYEEPVSKEKRIEGSYEEEKPMFSLMSVFYYVSSFN